MRSLGPRALWQSAALVTAVTALTGCTIARQQFDTPLPEAGQFTDGHTHYRDVLRSLGPPAQVSALDEGMVFLYEQVEVGENQVHVEIEYDEFPILKIVAGKGKAEGDASVLLFDGSGVLTSHAEQTWVRDLGRGFAVQLFVSVAKVTSTGGYDEAPVANYWGADLLKSRLSRALNRRNNLTTGQSGVERRGSPSGAGQHSLELLPFYVD